MVAERHVSYMKQKEGETSLFVYLRKKATCEKGRKTRQHPVRREKKQGGGGAGLFYYRKKKKKTPPKKKKRQKPPKKRLRGKGEGSVLNKRKISRGKVSPLTGGKREGL